MNVVSEENKRRQIMMVEATLAKMLEEVFASDYVTGKFSLVILASEGQIDSVGTKIEKTSGKP